MDDNRLYHWTSTLIPGLCIVALGAGVFVDFQFFKVVLQNLELPKVGFVVVLAFLFAYVVGLITWNLGYVIGPSWGSLGIYQGLASIRKDGGGNPSKSHLRSYHRERLVLANQLLKSLHSDEFPDYESWRLALFSAMEELPRSIGPRLSGQWEILGLLQSLNLVWLVGAALELVRKALAISYLGMLPSNLGTGGYLFVLCLLLVSTTLAYQFRNATLSRDVAYARILLTGAKTIETNDQDKPG